MKPLPHPTSTEVKSRRGFASFSSGSCIPLRRLVLAGEGEIVKGLPMFRDLLVVFLSLGLLICTGCNNSNLTRSTGSGSGSGTGSGSGSGSGGTGTGSGSGGGGGSGSGGGSGGGSSGSSSSANAAYVYIAGAASSSSSQIRGFVADSSGRLTEISGSPFSANDGSLAVNSTHLYGISNSATNIDAYTIGANGALTYRTSSDYQKYSHGCGSAAWLFTDRSGADLYDMEFDGDCANNFYQSFNATKANGSLAYLGTANGGAGSFSGIYLPATLLGNNSFAYEATNNSCMYYGVQAFSRSSNGLLNASNATTTLPAAPPNYRIYIPTFAAADSSNHIAITLLAANPPGCDAGVNAQIASFTADASGNLTTTNTFATMPTSSISNVTDLKISPAGDLLAVGGEEGLQLFHFNGAGPVTSYTGLLTVDPVSQMFWDTQNHLYVISQQANLLHVFTITGAQYVEAPGSPYPIQQPQFLAVDPLS